METMRPAGWMQEISAGMHNRNRILCLYCIHTVLIVPNVMAILPCTYILESYIQNLD